MNAIFFTFIAVWGRGSRQEKFLLEMALETFSRNFFCHESDRQHGPLYLRMLWTQQRWLCSRRNWKSCSNELKELSAILQLLRSSNRKLRWKKGHVLLSLQKIPNSRRHALSLQKLDQTKNRVLLTYLDWCYTIHTIQPRQNPKHLLRLLQSFPSWVISPTSGRFQLLGGR